MLFRIAATLLGLAAMPAQAAVTLDTSWLYLQTRDDYLDVEPGIGTLTHDFSTNDYGGCEFEEGECGAYETGRLVLQLTNTGFDYSASTRQNHALFPEPPNTFIDFFGSYRAGREMRFQIVETRSAVVTRCDVSCLSSFGFTVSQVQLGADSWQLDVSAGTAASVREAAQRIDHMIRFQVSEVPEPASWAMLIAGFGMVGAMARRRAASERGARLA